MESVVVYYDLFQRWIYDRYSLEFNNPDSQVIMLLVYDPTDQNWFAYNDGVYAKQDIQDINRIYFECMTNYQIPTSNPKLAHCIKYLEVICKKNFQWLDADENYDCVQNGIVNLKTHELISHTPELHFKYKVERNFLEDVDRVIPPALYKSLQSIPQQHDRENYLKYWINTIHKYNDESFLMCYGVKWGGKSTNLNIFSNMYGTQMTGKKALHLIAKRFGLSNIYDKRVNIHPDMPIVAVDPFTISLIKTLTGGDGPVEVEIKGKTTFTYPVQLFLAFGINQLMDFSRDAEKEIDSWMRRVILVEFPESQAKDALFKKSITDSQFLDEVYSWLVFQPCLPYFEEGEEEQWIQSNKKKWLMNSNPILKIIEENYVSEKGTAIQSYEVVAHIKAELEQEGSLVPTNLKEQITNALGTMGIFSNGRRGGSAQYINIRKRDGQNLPPFNLDYILEDEQYGRK